MADLQHVCNGTEKGMRDGEVCKECGTKLQAYHDEKKPGFVPDTVNPDGSTKPSKPGKINGVRDP